MCSIRDYKMKINKITQQSKSGIEKQIIKQPTQTRQCTMQIKKFRHINPQYTFGVRTPNIQQNITPQTLTTINSSLVVKQNSFGLESLLNNIPPNLYRKSVNSAQISSAQSPTNKIYKHSIFIAQQKSPKSKYNIQANYKTPIKDNFLFIGQDKFQSQCHLSTQESNKKSRIRKSKEKLTLNMARKVETFETVKTQNEGNESVIEQNEYSKILDKVAYPDYFSPKMVIKPIRLTL